MAEDKRALLLDIALEQFAEHGYEKTSTNQIIQSAGISKGILFHYFTSKKQLYACVLDHGLERIASYMERKATDLPSELFGGILARSRVKMEFYMQEPSTYKLLVGAFAEPVPREVKDIVAERRDRIARHLSDRSEQVDLSRARTGVDPAKALDLATGVVSLLSHRFIERHRDRPDRGLSEVEPFLDEVRQYLEMIEYGIYVPLNKEETEP